MKAKIRGIYSTALTKLLLDHDLEIVQPSNGIVERFDLDVSEDVPDLSVQNRPDLQGIEATGSAEAVGALRTILREELFDVVSRWRVELSCIDFEFPWDSKMKLDELRRTISPTVQRHHYYKACGGEISTAVDMAEKLLFRGSPQDEVELRLRKAVEPYLPCEGSEVAVEHAKLDGQIISLGNAVIEEYDETSRIKYVREMRSNGVYDGLGVEKEAGDKAVTEAKLGEYYMETRYYSQGGRFKGAYINFNTPMEPYPSKIRYIDLEVDVCVLPGGEFEVLDMAFLERAAREFFITGNLLETVKAKVSGLQATISDMLP
jgi:hypothetical protein